MVFNKREIKEFMDISLDFISIIKNVEIELKRKLTVDEKNDLLYAIFISKYKGDIK